MNKEKWDVQISVDSVEVDSAGEYIPDSHKELYFEPLSRCDTEKKADQLINAVLSRFHIGRRGAYDTRHTIGQPLPKDRNPREALDKIHRLMFGIEWHDERFRKIAEVLSAAGYSFEEDHLSVGPGAPGPDKGKGKT